MTASVFVDTNVLVYCRDTSETSKRARALAWMEHLWRTGTGRISSQVLAEYYAAVTRKLKPPMTAEAAWDDVAALFEWKPQPIDSQVLIRARDLGQRYRLSWWDAQIVAAAQLQGCALLLTEDLQDGAIFGAMAVRNPFRLAIEQAQPEYGLAVAAPDRHRGRGRPRRTPKHAST
jgi:predicted nucleic acid-binding protein